MVQFQGGSFDPGEVGDESIALQQSFTQQNRGWQRTAAMLKQNQDTQIRSAGKLWGQLGELAPSVNKLLQTKNVEWAKENIPWHYDHHMGKNQDANWGVTTDWVDRLLNTRIKYFN